MEGEMQNNSSDAPSWVPPEGQSLSDLIARVEAATGPDRAIDRALAYHLEGTGVEKERKLYAEIGDAMWVPGADGRSPYDKARGDVIRSEWQKGSRGKRGSYMPVRWNSCDGPRPLTNSPAFTASLDAALALVERVLPGWEWHVLFCPEHCGGVGCSYAGLNPETGAQGPSIALRGKRVPIALLAALLRALQAKASAEGTHDGSSPKSSESLPNDQ